MRTVVVGHGRSVLYAKGIDDYDFVVRLKQGLKIAGTKTDAICASSADYWKPKKPFWHFSKTPMNRAVKFDYDKWIEYFGKFNPDYWKPSIGCAACFFVKDQLGVDKIALAGFDSHFKRWNKHNHDRLSWVHDASAEKRCIESLFEVTYLGISELLESEKRDTDLDAPG